LASVARGLREAWPAGAFVVLVVPLCLFFSVVVPFGNVPDEPAHIGRAQSLLHGQLIGRRGLVMLPGGTAPVLLDGVDVDPAAMQAALVLGAIPPHVSRAALQRARRMGWSGKRTFVEIGTIAGYWPAFYVPAAVALEAARLFGASPFEALFAGRIANALCYGLLGTAALLLARRARFLLFCTLSVPMAFSLGASFNEDGLLIAATVLAAALLTRVFDQADPGPADPDIRRGRWSYRAAALLLANVVLAKPPYLPLLFMLLVPLPPPTAWAPLRPVLLSRLAVVALIALCVLAWTAVMVLHTSTPAPRPAYHPGPLWPGNPGRVFTGTDPMAQIRVLAADPLRIVTLPVFTILHDIWITRQTVGILGWLDVLLPPWLYRAWFVAIPAALLADLLHPSEAGASATPQPPRLPDTLLLLVGAFGCFLGVYLSQYLIWTNVGLARVEGPQGRYLLPIVPMIALALPRLRLRGGGGLSAALGIAPALVAALQLVALPVMLVIMYYVA